MSIETTEPQEIIITDTEQINLAVAAIAGWTNIKPWNDNPKSTIAKRTFIGTNEVHPELGMFIPNYVESLDAISKVFLHLKLQWRLETAWDGRSYFLDHLENEYVAETPALALCKLLLAINPIPISPSRSTIIEASFE